MWYVCGLVYAEPNHIEKRLPTAKLSTHSTILSTTSRTVLSHVFLNDTDGKIKECRYDFPLYDGVSVVGFTCHIGDRTIEGMVKERSKATEVYEEATSKGETAGLLAQGPTSDVFSTTLGNIPAGETIVVQVTYIGELKHDVSAQCTKFTIPTSIAPRYGGASSYPDINPAQGSLTKADGNGMEITVDISMGYGSIIREVRSPSHPIAIELGSTSSALPMEASRMSQASVTLSQRSTELDQDFHLEVVNNHAKEPEAVLETYAGKLRQRALMVTLVPELGLAPAKPEIIIVADRSGSMAGGKIKTLVRSLKIFLRSLPVGICFNICSFGSTHSFLWNNSRAYEEESLADATKHIDSFDANFGGTETLAAVKASIEARDVRQDLALILCTDGDIWQQEDLFFYLNKQVQQSEKPIRVFPLGIGNAVSSGLIEGVARAGKGFASTVGEHEKLDGKIVHMLKGALTENITDYTFDIKYGGNEDEEDDGFVLIENVADSLSVTSLDDSQTMASDNSGPGDSNDTGDSLPAVAVPKYLQTPQEIPPLYPSSRSTIYVMISPDAPQKQPTRVILKGTSCRGPISYEIPVEKLTESGLTIHQLAARKAVGELEEGRGWLAQAKDEKGTLLGDKFSPGPSFAHFGARPKAPKFDEMVKREAVRLGVEYQVSGKFCSFVAVEGSATATGPENLTAQQAVQGQRGVEYSSARFSHSISTRGGSSSPPGGWKPTSANQFLPFGASVQAHTLGDTSFSGPQIRSSHGGAPFGSANQSHSALFGSRNQSQQTTQTFGADGGARLGIANQSQSSTQAFRAGGGALFGSVSQSQPNTQTFRADGGARFGSANQSHSGLFGSINQSQSSTQAFRADGGALFGSVNQSQPNTQAFGAVGGCANARECLSGRPMTRGRAVPDERFEAVGCASGSAQYADANDSDGEMDMGSDLFSGGSPAAHPTLQKSSFEPVQDALVAIICLQHFQGFWKLDRDLLVACGIEKSAAAGTILSNPTLVSRGTVSGTILAITFLERKMGGEKDTWELIVDKAKGWLQSNGVEMEKEVEADPLKALLSGL